MKNIKKVSLIFENCDSMEFSSDNFENLLIDNIKESIHRVACNSIAKFTTCECSFTLFKSANGEHFELGIESEKTTRFERILRGGDITGIELEYEDDTAETFYPKWVGDSEYVNDGQYAKLTNRGDLKVYIGPNYDKGNNDSLVEYYNKDLDNEEMNFEENFFKD